MNACRSVVTPMLETTWAGRIDKDAHAMFPRVRR